MIKKKSTIKKQFFISYAIIFIAIITIVMSVYYVFYAKARIDNELKVQEVIVTQMTNSIQQYFDNLPKSVNQFYFSPWVRRIMYMQKDPASFEGKISPYDIYEYSKQILLTETTGSFGEKIIIYFNLSDKVMSNAGQQGWADFVEMNGLISNEPALINGSLFKDNNQHLIIPDCRIKINSAPTDCLAYIQTIPIGSYGSSNASVVFFIPIDQIMNQSLSYFHHKNVAIQLIHADNRIDSAVGHKGVEISADHLDKLMRSDTVGFQYESASDQYVYYKKINGIDLAYLVSIPADYIQSGAYQMLQVFLALFAMMLIFIIAISYKMSVSYSRPIEKIVTNISIDLKDNDLQSEMTDNEYRLIETAFRSLVSQNKELNTVIFKQNPMIRRYILQKLLEEDKTIPEGAQLEDLNVINAYTYMNCIVTSQTANFKQIKTEILNCLESSLSIVYLDVEINDKLIIIVNYDAPETLEIILEWIQQVLFDLRLSDCYLGIGRETEDMLDIHESYREACKALSYRYLIKDQCILYAEAFDSRKGIKSTIRPSDENKLIAGINLGQSEEVMNAYQGILEYNIEERAISIDELYELIDKLNKKLLHYLEQQFPGVPINLNANAQDFMFLDQYLAAFNHKIKKLFQAFNVENTGSNSMNKSIVNYIEKHLTDTDLSLKKMADFFGYTETYLSRYFKEQFDCNYYEYVVKNRLILAMNALRTTKRSVADIAAMSGFANDATFRRVFKAHIGTTPVQYRRQAWMNDPSS